MENWDVIIIGAGSAGCAAAIYAVRSGLKTLVLDEKFAGGNIADAPIIVNYPGFPSISGTELAQKMSDHARGLGANIHDVEAVTAMELGGETKTVTTTATTYSAKAIIIATGSHYKEVGTKGEKEFRGRGVSYCGVCDGPFFRKKNVAVVGGGNSALEMALLVNDVAKTTMIVHRRDCFRADECVVERIKESEIDTVLNASVKEIRGSGKVESIVLTVGEPPSEIVIDVDAVVIKIGMTPELEFLHKWGLELEGTQIKVNTQMMTSRKGVFSCGDACSYPGKYKQIVTASGEAATAANSAYKYIKKPYWA